MSENNVASLLLSHVNLFKEACQNAAIAANGSYDFEGTFYDHDVSAKIDLGQNNVTFYTHVLTNKGTKSTYKALYKAPISDVFCTPEEMPEVVEKHMSGLYVRVRDCKFLEENIPRLNADAMLPLVWEMAPSTWKVTRICAPPAGNAGMPRSAKRARERQSCTSSRSPCITWIDIAV